MTTTTMTTVEEEMGQEPGQKEKALAKEKNMSAKKDVPDEGLDGKPPALAKAGDEDEEEEDNADKNSRRRTPTGGSSEDSATPSQAAKLQLQQKNKLKDVVVQGAQEPEGQVGIIQEAVRAVGDGTKSPSWG